ncbi:MAG: choice-of-anchor V domain-containing protein [Poseidonia sp.]
MMRSLLLLLLATFLYIPSAHVDASSHGMEGYSEVGCNCHGEAPGENAMVSITGIPSVYEAGETYLLTVALSGGPEAAEQGHQGGFNLKASAGSLHPVDASTHVMDSGEITHEHAGANQRSWVVQWDAPISDAPIEFTVAGNIADGDHQPTDGDDWALASYSSSGENLSFSDLVRLNLPKVLAISLFVVPTAFLFWKNKA